MLRLGAPPPPPLPFPGVQPSVARSRGAVGGILNRKVGRVYELTARNAKESLLVTMKHSDKGGNYISPPNLTVSHDVTLGNGSTVDEENPKTFQASLSKQLKIGSLENAGQPPSYTPDQDPGLFNTLLSPLTTQISCSAHNRHGCNNHHYYGVNNVPPLYPGNALPHPESVSHCHPLPLRSTPEGSCSHAGTTNDKRLQDTILACPSHSGPPPVPSSASARQFSTLIPTTPSADSMIHTCNPPPCANLVLSPEKCSSPDSTNNASEHAIAPPTIRRATCNSSLIYKRRDTGFVNDWRPTVTLDYEGVWSPGVVTEYRDTHEEDIVFKPKKFDYDHGGEDKRSFVDEETKNKEVDQYQVENENHDEINKYSRKRLVGFV